MNIFYNYICLLFIFSFLRLSESANFLVYCPLFAHSHHKFLANIAETLTLAGHNVTFLAPIIARKYENVKYLEHTKDVIYVQPDEELEKLGDRMDSADFSRFWTEEPGVFAMAPMLNLFSKMFHKVYENFKKDLTVLDALKDRKFDALFYEVIAFNAVAIQQYLQIPTLYPTFSVTHHVRLSNSIGEPASPAVLSSPLLPFDDQMAFSERLANTIFDFSTRFFIKPPTIMSYNYPYDVIDIEEAESRASFVFLNSNPYLDFPRPLLAKTVLIGGISVNTTQINQEKLPEYFQNVLSKQSKNVLISFGSVMYSKDMPEQYKNTIVRVIESFPNVTFIWKYETDDVSFAGNLENLHFSKWVPQTALLADSRLSAFITHAGLGSVNELSYSGKPAILIPIFADQARNAKMLARHNGSILLDKNDLGNFEMLRDAVKAITENEKYPIHSEILRRQLLQQPIPPRDLLVKHAIFGAEFGELPSLNPYSRKMSFHAFFMIDIFLFLTAILLLFIVSLVFLLKAIIRKRITIIFRGKKQKTN
uniref:glucuronosyltransferase n=1 Tax=Caenorhabditis japonica TaxID=281687 RepID=A0A8R1HU96_CAEJA